MRVLGVITSSERGGGEFASVGALRTLRDRGHEVAVATNLLDMVPSEWAIPLDTGAKLSARSLVATALHAPRTVLRIARAIRTFGAPDVLVTFYKKEQLLSALVPVRGKRVWMEWGPLPLRMRTGLPRLMYALAARRVSRIIAVSANTRDSLLAIGIAPEKVEVVPPLVDTTKFDQAWADRARVRARWRTELGLRDDDFALIALTRLNRAKRNDVAIEAMSALPDHVVLVIAGVGPDEDELRALAARTGVGDRIRFVHAPPEGVHEFMHAFDAQVFAPQELEGLPIAIMCGRLAGLPLIVTAPSGIEHDLGMHAAVEASRPHDVAATAEAIRSYVEDAAKCAEDAAAARAWGVEHFTTEVVAARLEGAFEAAVRG